MRRASNGGSVARFLLAGALGLCSMMGATPSAAGEIGEASTSANRRIVIAVADKPEMALGAGSTPHGYDGLRGYAGSDRAKALTARLADEYTLREVSAWTIVPLHLRCVLFELPATADRTAMLARLTRDRRVRLAQPLQQFETFGTADIATDHSTAHAPPPYNDPYLPLQDGFTAIDAGGAQRWSRGDGVRVALIDTGLDATHPDLEGRIAMQRDFVPAPDDGRAGDDPGRDRHGTEVAGIIAAIANNHIGIAGVAPDAKLLSYRACWPTQANADAARCNTYTLALALGAAIDSGARLINLSLGGPPDPLLRELIEYALERDIIVVAALPPGGRSDGFPLDVAGVIAVAATGDADIGMRALAAPGRDILTLIPGGHYDYASGSSLATGHVSGAIALLLGIDPRLRAAAAYSMLKKTEHDGTPIDVCAAVQALRATRRKRERSGLSSACRG